MKTRRKFDGIKFYRKAAVYIPENRTGTGLNYINDQWLVDCAAINGVEIKCASVDIYEFEKMLQKSGKYQPFTDPDWMEGLEYSPVCCYVAAVLIHSYQKCVKSGSGISTSLHLLPSASTFFYIIILFHFFFLF